MIKRSLLYLFTIFFVANISGQVAPSKYWVKFTDKNNSPYSIDNPEEFLSDRAIQRRANHNIPVDESDLPVNPSYVQAVIDEGATLLNRSRWMNSVTVQTGNPSVIDAINDLPFVLSVEKAAPPSSPNEFTSKPFFVNESYSDHVAPPAPEKSYGKSYNYGQAYNQIDMINGIPLHDDGFDGEGMIIAVLDAGFLNVDQMSAFDSLWINNQIIGSRDFVSPGSNVYNNSHSHGAMVLSCMGSNLPGSHVGTAPKADYWLLRSEDGGSEYLIEELNWVSAAEFADSAGADLINSSLGYTTFDDPAQDHSYADMDGNTTPITIGADKAVSKGMIVVNSAGNSGGSSWQYIGAPADGDSVFSIGAVDPNGNYASFSSTGPTYDGRLKPNVVAQGQSSVIVEPWGGSVSSGNGTSFSSPIMAGMLACLWQANPEYRNTDIMNAVEMSASQYSNPDNFLGYGIPNFEAANDIMTVIEALPGEERFVEVSPNPFRDKIVIEINHEFKETHLTYELIEVTGKTIRNGEIGRGESQITINNLSQLKRAVYILKVTAGDRVNIIKLAR